MRQRNEMTQQRVVRRSPIAQEGMLVRSLADV
jgi:hypothetical protein